MNPYYSEYPDRKALAASGSSSAHAAGTKGGVTEKDSGFPGVPGATQKDRSAGVPKKGSMGPFTVKSEGV